MYQPRKKPQTAQRDIDERVGGADADLDPDCNRGEEDGEEGEEEVGAAHCCAGLLGLIWSLDK